MEKTISRISATIIADSLNTHGQRLTTFVLEFPRIVLAEFNTHRMLSRNSASSRAIPFEKMLERCEKDPFIPIRWMKDHPGMQGNEYYEGKEAEQATTLWLAAKREAVQKAKCLSGFEKGADGLPIYGIEITKQFCNRLLEPFMWHKVICTGSEWENFFSLRAESGAEIHIQALAYEMLTAYNASTPKQLKAGEWHIPFGDQFDPKRLVELEWKLGGDLALDKEGLWIDWERITKTKIKIATARCARLSYNTFEGKDDYEADIKLHDRLASSGHWSPFEHCAKAMNEDEYYEWTSGHDFPGYGKGQDILGWCGNFRGFISYRKMFPNENRQDTRVIKK